MTINVIIDSTYYDITNLVADNVNYSDDIGKELDISNFVIPVCKSDSISGLDLSTPFPQLTRVEINIEGEIKRYYVREDEVEDLTLFAPFLYSHTISLIEPTKLLELKPIPDMTITQPQGDYTTVTSQLDIDPDTKDGSGNLLLNPLVVNNITLVNTTTPTDTSYIDGNKLKIPGREYTTNVQIVVFNNEGTGNFDWDIVLKINGITRVTGNIDRGIPGEERIGQLSYTYTPSVIDELVTVEITPNTDDNFDVTYAVSVGVVISTKLESVDSPVWYDDEVIDKALLSQKVSDINDTGFSQEFTLEENTRNRIKNQITPELTLERNTLWELLEKIADLRKAIPRVGKNAWNEISFDFIDDFNKETFVNENKTEVKQQLILDKFSTAVEVNADNVIESIEDQAIKVEPYEDGWMTLRSDSEGPNQLTDVTVGLKVRSNIYKHKQILAKGFAVEYTDLTTSPATTEWDISDYVVEQQKWNALPNLAYDTPTERLTVNQGKGNTIYYTKTGQRYVNFGYRAPKLTSSAQASDQVIYQIIAAVATQVSGKTVRSINGSLIDSGAAWTLADLLDTQYRVYYTAYKKVRVKLYKPNARDYEIDSILYSNESDKVNDNVTLGRLNQAVVNKSGNRTNLESGLTTDINEVPRVGQVVNGNQIITKVDVTIENGLYSYGIKGYVDYAELSNYVGIKSEYRQYQIPDTEIVERILVYEQSISVGRGNQTPTYSVLTGDGMTVLSNPFTGATVSIPTTYHRMQTRNQELNPGDAGWTTFDSESEGPVDIISLGTTTAIKVTTKDNYSVDDIAEELYDPDTPSVAKWYQNNFLYKNGFGQYNSARYGFYQKGQTNNSISDGNAYPAISQTSFTNKFAELDVRVLADAREATHLTLQINFFSQLESGVENFRVYDGIAKYNGFAIEGATADIVPVLLLDNYFPSVETITIDPTKYTETTMLALQGTPTATTVPITFDINVPITSTSILYTGWGLIEKNSGELIWLAKDSIQSNDTSVVVYRDVIDISTDETKGK